MSNSATITLGYTGTDFTRKIKLADLEAGALSSVKAKVLAVNASLAGGTDNGLSTFFLSDDYDAAQGIGNFSSIVAAQVDSVETEILDLTGGE